MVKIKKNKKYGLGLISLILLLTCLPLVMNASNVVIELNYNIFLKNQLHKSNNALARENGMLDVLAKKLAQEKELPGLIQLGDVQKIFSFLQSKKSPIQLPC